MARIMARARARRLSIYTNMNVYNNMNMYIYNTQMLAVALGPWASHTEDHAEP